MQMKITDLLSGSDLFSLSDDDDSPLARNFQGKQQNLLRDTTRNTTSGVNKNSQAVKITSNVDTKQIEDSDFKSMLKINARESQPQVGRASTANTTR